MNRILTTLGAIVAAATMGLDAQASGVGAAFYRPAPVAAKPMAQPAAYCADCTSQVGCSDCASCKRLGFACVDHATPAPCSAEGGCRPKRSTFGHYQVRWRRWPGDVDETGPAVGDDSEQEDTLMGPIDPPPATEEDQQAPPPIEDEVVSEQSSDGESQLEISLPPLPEVRPEPALPPRQAEPADPDGPPALPFGEPFGEKAPALPEFVPPQSAWNESAPEQVMPAARHEPPRMGDDMPPPLPSCFKSASTTRPIRLPLPGVNPAGPVGANYGYATAGDLPVDVRQVSHNESAQSGR